MPPYKELPALRHPYRAGGRGAITTVLLAACCLAAELQAAPLLRCKVEQGGTAKVLDVVPVAEPYGVAPVDINENFRFQAVVVGTVERVEYIKLYVYGYDRRHAMLLHQASYPAPVADRDERAMTLTGTHYVYSPGLERELQYSCALLEAGA